MIEQPEFIDALERAIDREGLQDILQMVSSICWEEATHVLTNWQDEALAEQWEKAAKAVERASVSNAVISISLK